MESLASTISETASVIEIHDDLALIDNINNKLSSLDNYKQHDIETLNLRLEELQQQLDNIVASINTLKSSTDGKATRTELNKLNNEIFSSARNLTSLNMKINSLKLSYNENLRKLDSLESDLAALTENFINHTSSVSIDAGPQDPRLIEENSNLIKLKLYQSLGLKINFQTGEVLILNKKKKNITLLKLDDSYTEYFISNFIWDNI